MLEHYWQPEADQQHEHAQHADEQAIVPYDPASNTADEHERDANTGVLSRLNETTLSAATRTVQRLHRNLGHPTNLELCRTLQQRGASPAVLQAAQEHKCDLCNAHRPPPQVPKSHLRTTTPFNSRIQADTLWVHLPTFNSNSKPQPVPVISVIDTSTKLMAARVIQNEQTPELIQALERAWIRHFGPPSTLQVDELRGWSSEALRSWTSDHGIELEISPGQAHTRLGIIERRHQVLRRGIELFLNQNHTQAPPDPKEAVTQALCYVLPQINNKPNVSGFSPTQWAMGYQPRVPGVLMDEDLTTSNLTPSEAMETKLHLQKTAATAIIEADNHLRLRRALLRQHQAQQDTYETGQQVFYWRDAPGGAGPKIRWKGPATIVMVEPGKTGPATDTHWIVHGTTLLRVSPEHLRPHLNHSSDTDPTDRAKQALQQVRNRSTTLFIDLQKTNKRKRTEVLTEDEEEQDTPASAEIQAPQADYWDVEEDGLTWHRVHIAPRHNLYVPSNDDTAPWQDFQSSRLTTIRRAPPLNNRAVLQDDWTLDNADRAMPFAWTGDTTFTLRTGRLTTRQTTQLTDTTPQIIEDAAMTPNTEIIDSPMTTTPTELTEQPTAEAMPQQTPQSIAEPEPAPPSIAGDMPERAISTNTQDPAASPSAGQQMTIPEHQRQLYTPAAGETFAQQRARIDRQETLSYYQPTSMRTVYGPNREAFERPHQITTPYGRHATTEEEDVNKATESTYDTDIQQAEQQTLPPGWKLEKGYLTLDMDNIQDEWQLHRDKLVRRHYLPRNRLFDPSNEQAGCPIPVQYLGKDRITKSNGVKYNDRWKSKSAAKTTHTWTGTTTFKIPLAYRKLAAEYFYQASQGHQSYIEPQEYIYNTNDNTKATGNHKPRPHPKTKARKEQLSEKKLTVEDRQAFLEAKKSELDSFFKNDVWEYDDGGNAPAGRVLRAHFILKWSKWPDGSPRAKARLITQGFRDPDALEGKIATESPTLGRLGRNFIMSVASNNGWSLFCSDISTAFLQGRKHPSHRTLWIKLPADARRVLNIHESEKLMKLKKPMYGLCDAPRAWFLEARDRMLKLGAVPHPLDPCLFLLFDKTAADEMWTSQKNANGNVIVQPPLIGMLGIHVDDILGCGNGSNEEWNKFVGQLKSAFNFRTWEQDTGLEYCGAKIHRHNKNSLELKHTQYMAKQKPISSEALVRGEERPVTEKERTMFRGVVGALQWPATQSSPHLQAAVSQLAGKTSKCLKFAKMHSDVGLKFDKIGDPSELTFIAYCDAAFASRHDLSSQGGYLVMLVHNDVTTGSEGKYHLVDWRSWKLPRVARSSLAAESQAASEAADALLYVSTFWKLIWSPYLALDDAETPKLHHSPRLVTDAKALYDLLIKTDLQTGSQADKRTTIEVLVTQDKLACVDAKTLWVSSELQYADGMTKQPPCY